MVKIDINEEDIITVGEGCVLTQEGKELANEVADEIDETKPKESFWEVRGLKMIGEGESRVAVVPIVDGLMEGDECVIKFSLDEVPEQNRAEIANWKSAPPGVKEVLAPVTDHDPDGEWLVMPRATEFGTPVDLVRIETQLEEHGWSCRGLHPENIGIFDGEPKALDYGFPCLDNGSHVTRLQPGGENG